MATYLVCPPKKDTRFSFLDGDTHRGPPQSPAQSVPILKLQQALPAQLESGSVSATVSAPAFAPEESASPSEVVLTTSPVVLQDAGVMSTDFSSVPYEILRSSPISSELKGSSRSTDVYDITDEEMPASFHVEGGRSPPTPNASDLSHPSDVTQPMALTKRKHSDRKTGDSADHLAKWVFFLSFNCFSVRFISTVL